MLKELSVQVESLRELVYLVEENLKFNLNVFWIVIGLFIAMLSLSGYILVQNLVEKGLNSKLTEMDNNLQEISLRLNTTNARVDDVFISSQKYIDNRLNQTLSEGHNANGTYIMLNKTLMCAGKFFLDENEFMKSIVFPASFIDSDIVITCNVVETIKGLITAEVDIVKNDSYSFTVRRKENTRGKVAVVYTAIGRFSK